MFRLIICFGFLGLASCGQKLTESVSKEEPLRDDRLQISGYQVDVPKEHSSKARGRYQADSLLDARIRFYPEGRSFEIPEMKSVEISIFSEICDSQDDILRSRQRQYERLGWIAGRAPEFYFSSQTPYKTLSVAQTSKAVLEYIFSPHRSQCLIMNVSIDKKSDRFNIKNLGDLTPVLRALIKSVQLN